MTGLRLLFHLLLLQLTLLSVPLGLQAQVDPRIEWREIETESAFWLFDAKHQDVAEYYILQFERARAEVLSVFKEPPPKVTILLLDNTDLANGSARVTPHPVISLFTVAPSPYSSIGEFRDYVHELLVHEYTHILNMEPVHGWMSPLYWVFGSVAHPNMVLPRWYTEGLAVYNESRFSQGGGRLNSQHIEGLARALTLEKKWNDYPLSDLNDSHPDWIGGSRAYLFGGMLWHSIVRDGGTESIANFNQSHSRRLPYLLNGVIESQLGRSYQDQLARAYKFWDLGAQRQLATLAKAGRQPNQRRTHFEGSSTHPRISPDGRWMISIRNSLDGSGDILLTPRQGRKGFFPKADHQVVANTRSQYLAWHPDSEGFVYEKLTPYKTYNRFYDLYFYDQNSKKNRRLTRGQRAHSPCFAPNGKNLYFLANAMASKKIMELNWSSQDVATLYEAPIGDDLRSLACSESGVYFVEHKAGHSPTLNRLNLKNSRNEVVFSKIPVGFVRNTKKGLIFSSSASGVRNLYQLNSRGQYRAITHSNTQVIDGEMDPTTGALYFSQTTSTGPQMFYLERKAWQSLPDRPPQVTAIAQWDPKETGSLTTDVSRKPQKSREFSPWRYLYPNHWIPFFYLVDGGTLYQATSSAGDPLGINTLSFVGQWDTLTKKAGGSVSYINQSLPVTMGVGFSDFYSFFYADRTALHFTNANALLSYPLGFLDSTRLLFRWNYSALDRTTRIFIRQGPQLELAYRDTDIRPNDISVSSGWKGQLGHRNYLADLGNVSYGETYGHLGTFWSSFTPKRHVFYLGLNGSYAPQLNNGFFSTSTLAGPFLNPQITNTSFLQRGYPTGLFIARSLLNANAEYRFPLYSVFKGWTSPPAFIKTLQGSFVFDATTADGTYSNSLTRSSQITEIGRFFTGYGLELDSKVNMGFHVPITFTLGMYYGQQEEAFGGFTTFFNLRL